MPFRPWLSSSRTLIAVLAVTILLPATLLAAPPEDSAGRYMIEFKEFPGAAATVRGLGGSVVHEFPAMNVVAAHLPARAVAALSANPNVALIAEDPKRYPMAQSTPYGIPMVQADLLSDASAANRKVCIIDSGFSSVHEDLAGNSVSGANNSGTGNWYQDQCGHGTHVAGTVAALNNGSGVVGVLPNGKVSLFIVKVFGDNCAWSYSSDLIAALNTCRNNGANVVSMSLGGPKGIGPWEQNAFDSAWSGGVLSIAAAGNDGTTSLSYPASYNSVVSVAAIDQNKVVADFSQKNSQVEVAAPGVAVNSTVPFVETNSLSVSGGPTFTGGHIENSPRTNGSTGGLVDGGICDSAGSWAGKVVLCQRGTISFRDKVENARAGGATSAAIYNNVAGDFAGTCDDGTGTTCGIPAISLSMENGQAATAYLGSSSTLVSRVTYPANGYEAWNGTSMATPHVSGVAALVWSYNTSWTNSQIRTALQATAQDLGAAGRDNSYGYGLVQARDALCYLNPGAAECGGQPGNNAPTAGFTYSASGLTASFTDASTDSDGSISSWSWSFGDGATSSAQNPSHTYAAGGSYTVTLTVTDNGGATGTASQNVTVSSGQTGGVTLTVTGYKVKGVQNADLAWSGATSTSVDIFRDGGKIVTTANDGAHTDNIGQKGGGSHTYKVCEAGTSTCSPDVTISF